MFHFQGATPREPKHKQRASFDVNASYSTPLVGGHHSVAGHGLHEQGIQSLSIEELHKQGTADLCKWSLIGSPAACDDLFRKIGHANVKRTVLLDHVNETALGPERLRFCKVRRHDAAWLVQELEDKVTRATTLASETTGTPDNLKPVHRTLLGVRLSLAVLRATEKQARRCSPQLDETRKQNEVDVVTTNVICPAPECSELSSRVEALLAEVKELRKWQEAAAAPSDWLQNVISCCTTRQRPSDPDHDSAVQEYKASLIRSVVNSELGDVLCCAPADININHVGYYSKPGQQRMKGKDVLRGHRVLIKSRIGGWISDDIGWLPLWYNTAASHPREADLLFLFDHQSKTYTPRSIADSAPQTPRSIGSIGSNAESNSPFVSTAMPHVGHIGHRRRSARHQH